MDQQRLPWPARMAADIGKRVHFYRKWAGMSAQQLAASCAELGMPSISRTVITKLENGRRESAGVAELQVLAQALGVAPVLLLFPIGYVPAVEVLPGNEVDPWGAYAWFIGNSEDPADPAAPPQMGIDSPIVLWDEHDRFSGMLWSLLRERRRIIAQAKAPEEAAGPSADVQIEAAAAALRRIRAGMRAVGMTPPDLSPEKARIIGEEARDDGSR